MGKGIGQKGLLTIHTNFQELEKALLEYLGTVSPKKDHPVRQDAPCAVNRPDPKLQHQVWHLKDSDERATAYISGTFRPLSPFCWSLPV